MRLVLADIDDLSVTPADLSDLWFGGSPEAVEVSTGCGCAETVAPVRSVSLDRPSGTSSTDSFYDLSQVLGPPCDATVTWGAGRCFLHVVSHHYCTLDEVLDYGDEKRQSPRQLKRTEAEAFRARAVAETVCDDLCGRTFRATYKAEDAWAGSSLVHQLEWPAYRVLTPGWTLVGDGLVKHYAPLRCGCGATRVQSTIEYVAGTDAGVPADVRRAVAKLAASYLTLSKVPDRAVYESTEAGMTRYTLADSEHTGIPDVDAVLSRHARKRWAVL